MTFAWKNGRQIDTITKSSNTFEFKYNSNGMRTQKDDDNYTTNYYYDSNNNLVGLNLGGSTLFFYYDSNGNVTSFSNNDTMYYYVKNIQGDIVKIIMVKSKNKIKSKVNNNIQLEMECLILKPIKYNKKSCKTFERLGSIRWCIF